MSQDTALNAYLRSLKLILEDADRHLPRREREALRNILVKQLEATAAR